MRSAASKATRALSGWLAPWYICPRMTCARRSFGYSALSFSRAGRSASRFRASADFVVHSNLPDLVAAGAAAAAAKTRETARAETRFIILIELLVQMRERTCPEVSPAGSSQYTRASRRQVPWAD